MRDKCQDYSKAFGIMGYLPLRKTSSGFGMRGKMRSFILQGKCTRIAKEWLSSLYQTESSFFTEFPHEQYKVIFTNDAKTPLTWNTEKIENC